MNDGLFGPIGRPGCPGELQTARSVCCFELPLPERERERELTISSREGASARTTGQAQQVLCARLSPTELARMCELASERTSEPKQREKRTKLNYRAARSERAERDKVSCGDGVLKRAQR